MKLKCIFLVIVAVSSIIVVGLVVHVNNLYQVAAFGEQIEVFSSRLLRKYANQTGKELPTRKPFVYLTETEQCLPPYLASSSQIGDPQTCNCDVIVLSFRAVCQENTLSHVSYLFDPNTLFASGRNVLFFAVMDRRPGYHYYIFLNDDTVLQYNKFTPADMKTLSPFRAVETWLLDYEPVVGVLDYNIHHGVDVILKLRRKLCGINDTSLVLPTVFFDALFNAYHHKAIEDILPYPTQHERECAFCSNRKALIAVEVKFGGQALMFAPVTGGNRLHRRHDETNRINMTAISQQFVKNAKREAPAKLRSHVIFEILYERAKPYLSLHSKSYCANVTRHQPIIPYKHLLSDVWPSLAFGRSK